jgi:hypothetical protein
MNITHQSKRAVYVVGGLYLTAGLALTAHGAFGGRITETLCGFLITNVGILGGWLVLIVAGLSDRTADAVRRLDRIGESLRRIEERRTASSSGDDDARHASLDLSAIGYGDPSVLTGAVLDRSVFPRLAGAMDSPPTDEQADEDGADENRTHAPADDEDDRDMVFQAGGPGGRNMLRRWRVALREGDVRTCRQVLSTLLDTADPALVGDFQREFDRLVERVEGDLRRRFAEMVRDGDYPGAIAVGREIITRLPESPIAHDYRRIEPHLIRRSAAAAQVGARPSRSRLA